MKLIPIFMLISFVTLNSWAQNESENVRTINLDFKIEKGGLNNFFNECVGAGRANEGLRADWQQQLTYVKQECGFRYIRFHGLLTDDMGVYKEDRNGNPQYNYMYIDALFDFLLSIDIKPFVELGFMPNALASGEETIFWWKGNVTPPKDYDKWGALIENLVQHWTDRYGVEEVKSWYFEVWNEPNLTPYFWTSTMEEYFKLYEYSARAVKKVNPAYRIGGPGTAGAAWEPEMIEFCNKNNVPIDFVSAHAYGVNQGYLDEYGQAGTILAPQEFAVSGDVLQSRKEISESAMPGLELHYTEWSASYTPADPIHDSYHEASYVLQKLKQVGDAAQSMSYWVFTDIFEESAPRFTPFHGGFGMLNTQGINKPVFYAYQFLNKLGNTELENNDSKSWVCRDEDGNIQILAYDFTYTHPGDSVNNQEYYIRDLPAKDKGKLKINISNLPAGNYSVEVYKVGYRCNDAYTSYYDLGRPDQLTRLQVEQIKKINNGSPVSAEIIIINQNSEFIKELDIRENDVYFLNIIKL
ncbi:MAG: glycoside hydrolase [Bacteroidales bacterium]|nr:glycoside hydrolase [Bacteroidales bacterium]MBN2820927.1 glycoside hydrolase [Bacteroidales bacterium]